MSAVSTVRVLFPLLPSSQKVAVELLSEKCPLPCLSFSLNWETHKHLGRKKRSRKSLSGPHPSTKLSPGLLPQGDLNLHLNVMGWYLRDSIIEALCFVEKAQRTQIQTRVGLGV